MSIAISIEHLAVQFGEKPLMENFSLEIPQGRAVMLSGPSGCGKSTVLRAILGFVTPTAGAVSVEGTPVDAHGVWKCRRRIAYLPQAPDLGRESVIAWMKTPFQYRANSGAVWDERRFQALAERLSLPEDVGNAKATSLSGGEKQRLALIGALMLDRRILLLDEPTAALDADNRQAVYQLLGELKDTTLLFIAHDDARAEQLADTVVRMPGG